MMYEGLQLTLLGMGVVFAFLGLLVVVIRLNARLLKPLTDRELLVRRDFSPAKKKNPRHHQELEEKRRILAVISAAIVAHRARLAAAPTLAPRPVATPPGGIAAEPGQARRTTAGPARRVLGLTPRLVRDPATRQHLQWLRQHNHNP